MEYKRSNLLKEAKRAGLSLLQCILWVFFLSFYCWIIELRN